MKPSELFKLPIADELKINDNGIPIINNQNANFVEPQLPQVQNYNLWQQSYDYFNYCNQYQYCGNSNFPMGYNPGLYQAEFQKNTLNQNYFQPNFGFGNMNFYANPPICCDPLPEAEKGFFNIEVDTKYYKEKYL